MFQNLFFKFLNKFVWNRRTIARPVAYYDIGQFSIFFLTSEKNLIGHNWYQDPLTRRHLTRGVVIFHKNKESWAVQYGSRHTHTHTHTHTHPRTHTLHHCLYLFLEAWSKHTSGLHGMRVLICSSVFSRDNTCCCFGTCLKFFVSK